MGPGDDAAVLTDGTVLTVDAMTEGVHWDVRWSAEDVGRRLVAVNASDVAACGADPTWALLTISLPDPIDAAWVREFTRGVHAALGSVPLIGGDTTRTEGPIHVSMTLGGRLRGEPLLRTGARVGDGIWVSGVLGAASAAFHLGDPACMPALLRPEPPLHLGPLLAERGLASAGMDLSDGLATDLARLCAASDVGARVDPALLPLPDVPQAIEHIAFGDDYQLLVTSSQDLAPHGLTRIGTIVAGQGAVLIGRDWPAAWHHFQRSG
ncbi:MAG: thiamine-phosphate kinase [Proteobacteria bacterium]|nr:thiamine-phosphate kinase [Pseudomonadota bacterium]MCP4917719.1 thiamine-phosphate kinase [Pseudomonadota bacterium]